MTPRRTRRIADDGAEAGTDEGASTVQPETTHVVAEWISDPKSPLISCRFDPTGTFVVAGAEDLSLRRWELETGKETALQGHQSWVRGLAFSSDGETLYAADFADRLIAWRIAQESPEPVWSIEAHNGWVRAVDVSPDDSLIATCGHDHLVKLWSAEDGAPIRTFEGHDCHVYNVLFHPEGKRLVSGDLKGNLIVWDVETGDQVRRMEGEKLYIYDKSFRADIGGVRSMAFNGDGSRLACAGITNVSNAFAGVGEPIVLVLDWESGELAQAHESEKKLRGVCWGVAFHPDDFLVGVSGGGSGGHLFFWKPDGATEVFTEKLPTVARDLALHPDQRRLAIAYADGALRLHLMAPEEEGEAEAEG